MKVIEKASFFCGLITMIFGVAILYSGLGDIFVFSGRWISGGGCLLLGCLCVLGNLLQKKGVKKE